MPLTVTVTNPVRVGQIVGLSSIDAYPNPTAGALTLDLDLGANVLDLTVAILDLQGRTLQSTNWSAQTTGQPPARPHRTWPPATTPSASPTAPANGASPSSATKAHDEQQHYQQKSRAQQPGFFTAHQSRS